MFQCETSLPERGGRVEDRNAMSEQVSAVGRIDSQIRQETEPLGPSRPGNWQLGEFIIMAHWTDLASGDTAYTRILSSPTMPHHSIQGLLYEGIDENWDD